MFVYNDAPKWGVATKVTVSTAQTLTPSDANMLLYVVSGNVWYSKGTAAAATSMPLVAGSAITFSDPISVISDVTTAEIRLIPYHF